MQYDVIIIGAGPAGFATGIYLGRAQIKTLIIGDINKSGLYSSANVENYPGFIDPISGPELLSRMQEQARKYGVQTITHEVINLTKKNSIFSVKIETGEVHEATSVIICTGMALLTANIKNEKELKGRGVHFCVACDGIFYKNKKVAVIGNSNYAVEEAYELLTYTKDITIISNGREFEFSKEIESIISKNQIKLRKDRILEFIGQEKLQELKFKDNSEAFDGVFIAIGTASAASFANKLGLLVENEAIIIDRAGKTNVEGIYAAGLATGGNNQIAKSVGEGCNAAISIIKKMKGLANYIDHT